MCSSPHTSFEVINDSVVKSERSELVRGCDPSVAYSAHTMTGDVRRAPTRLLLKILLAAGAKKTEITTLDRPPNGHKI